MNVVDPNDVVLGHSTKSDIKKRGLNYRCVQIFLFNGANELLICKRPETKKMYAGRYASVMGHVRRGESYEESAYREVREELGVNTRLARITKFSILEGGSRIFQEIYSGGVSGELKPDKTEISEYKFISIRDLRSEMVTNPHRFAQPFLEAVRAFMKAKNIY